MERHRQGSFSCSVLIMLTKYCSQSREMASNASSSRLTRPRKSDVSSRRRPFAEFSSVAGANAPAFVERTRSEAYARCPSCVAGANAPAFVERWPSYWLSGRWGVSPELTLRPSLSVPWGDRHEPGLPVSPELTLRPSLSAELRGVMLGDVAVSPELTLRPSLSEEHDEWQHQICLVSPELTLRPSLSESKGDDSQRRIYVSPELTLRPSLSESVGGALR